MFSKAYKNYFELKNFNFKLFFALCAQGIIPVIYQTVRTAIISTNSHSPGFDIIGQMEWFDLINETLIAFLIVPLYSVLNNIIKRTKENFKYYVFKLSIITFVIYFIFHIFVFSYGIHLIDFMNPSAVNKNEILSYLKLETAAFIIGIIPTFTSTVFIITNKTKTIYYLLVLKMTLLIFGDCVIIPYLKTNGVAISNIITNILLSAVSFAILIYNKEIKADKFRKNDLIIIKQWFKTGVFSGFQQFIDNIFYAIMIVKMVNLVSQAGNYWLANNFIWGWLLIPITALTEIIRTDCKQARKINNHNYYRIIFVLFIIWCSSIPFWNIFYENVEMLENHNEIFTITIKLFPFYLAYALSIVPDNIFIGFGKTKYNMINSLIVNIFYYGTFFLLCKNNIIQMNIDVIILMFGFGMVFHLFISTLQYKYFKKQCYELN